MDDRDPFAPLRFPSAARPLLGLTVLLVEDSRFASEAMRLLCMRSGARIRRADCLRSARRHLQVYRPSVLIVDVGLPDGSGAELIAEAAQASPRIGLILGISGDDHRRDACIAAGADGFLEKPLHSIASFQELILSHLPQDHQPPAPRELRDETIVPDTTAYRDDIAHVADLLAAGEDEGVLDYVTQFLEGVAVLAGDSPLRAANQSLRAARAAGQPLRSDLANLAGLLQDRIADRVAI
ncbi:MAG: response regulator [Paracoccaceae bacterium]|nr:response regulator [Paracoccaceae bacterium]